MEKASAGKGGHAELKREKKSEEHYMHRTSKSGNQNLKKAKYQD